MCFSFCKHNCVCTGVIAAVEHGSKGIKLNNNSLTLQVDDLSVCVQKQHLAEESVNSFQHLLMN